MSGEERQELVRRAKGGDRAAILEVLKSNGGLIDIAARQSGAWQLLETEDVQQSGYCGLLEAIDSYDPSRGAFSTWAIWRIKRWLLVAIRSEMRNGRIGRLAPDSEGDILAREQSECEAASERVRLLLDGLASRERYVIRLAFGLDDGQPKRIRQIAKITGLSIGAVAKMRRDAMRRLAATLDE